MEAVQVTGLTDLHRLIWLATEFMNPVGHAQLLASRE